MRGYRVPQFSPWVSSVGVILVRGGALIVLVCPVCFPDHAVPHGVQGYTLSDRACKSLFEELTDRSALMSWRVEYKCIPDLAMCVVVGPTSKMRRLNVV